MYVYTCMYIMTFILFHNERILFIVVHSPTGVPGTTVASDEWNSVAVTLQFFSPRSDNKLI